jgi:hypothetical protein
MKNFAIIILSFLSFQVFAESVYFKCEISRESDDQKKINHEFYFMYPEGFNKTEIKKDLRFFTWKLEVDQKGVFKFKATDFVGEKKFSVEEERNINPRSIIRLEKNIPRPDLKTTVRLVCSPEKK